MKISEIKRLASSQSRQDIEQAISLFEASRENKLAVVGDDDGEILSNLLAAQFVQKEMQKGVQLQDAIREYSRRVRDILK